MKTKTEDRPQGTLSFMLQVEEMPLKVMTIIKKVEEQEVFGVRSQGSRVSKRTEWVTLMSGVTEISIS